MALADIIRNNPEGLGKATAFALQHPQFVTSAEFPQLLRDQFASMGITVEVDEFLRFVRAIIEHSNGTQ